MKSQLAEKKKQKQKKPAKAKKITLAAPIRSNTKWPHMTGEALASYIKMNAKSKHHVTGACYDFSGKLWVI